MILPKRRVKYDICEISCLCKIGINRNPHLHAEKLICRTDNACKAVCMLRVAKVL